MESNEFREYVATRQAALLRTARLLTGDWQQAEDLVQATLARIWPRWKRLTAHGEDPDAYVRRAMVTHYLTWRRRHWWAEHPTAPMPDIRATGDPLTRVDLRNTLAQALRSLPPAQRAVLVLRYYQDLSTEQTAAWLGITTGTVKSQTTKALAKLQTLLPVGVFHDQK